MTWKMDSVLTVPSTQLESNVNDASQGTLVIPQDNQIVLVGKYTYIAILILLPCIMDRMYMSCKWH